MSQNTSVESSTQSLPNPSINPALQAALVNLDIQLEEELARYRRQRAGRPVISSRGLGRNQTPKPIDLMSIDKSKGKTQPLALGMSTAPTVSFPLPRVNQTPAAEPPNPTSREQVAQTSQPDDSSLSKAAADNLAGKESVTEQLTPPKEPAEEGGGLVPVAADDQAPPEDYLESSEKLLRSLSEEEVIVQSQKRSTNRLLTPLSVGSILLILLSSATLVYILTNPATFTALGLDRLFASKTPTPAKSPTGTTVAKTQPAKDSPIVNGPKLDSEEFVDLNLNTLSHLPANPTPSVSPSAVPSLPELPNQGVQATAPSVVGTSVLPRRASDLSRTLLTPTLQQLTVPPRAEISLRPVPAPAMSALSIKAPSPTPAAKKGSSAPATAAAKQASPASAKSAATKTPQASPSPAQVAASSGTAGGKYYYVLVNDSGKGTLKKAQTMVPDAYVEKFPQGTRIQMGAFKLESEATTLVDQLKQQGISASIYHP